MGWLADGKAELNLNTMLAKAAELHSADFKSTCRILFEVYDEDEKGLLSAAEAGELLQSWCIGKYGAIYDDSDNIIKTLMTHVELDDGGGISKQEWMRLADKFPELFDTEPQYTPHVRYLRLLCRVRMDPASVEAESPPRAEDPPLGDQNLHALMV